ncbi:MAG TPA: ABC transporter permease subunit [Ruminiclostridium sp.]
MKANQLNISSQSKTNRLIQNAYKQRYLLMMVIPGVIFMLVFNFYPIYFAQIAFKDYNITMGTNLSLAPWLGFTHIIEFFKSPDFANVMADTLGISFYKLLIGFPIPIVFAILLNEIAQTRFKKAVQTITYLPHFLSWIILGGILLIWMSDSGLITNTLYHLHLISSPANMLANAKYFWPISVASEVWKEFGWNSIIYLAAIATIDMEMFEAARIDGAGKFRQIWNITLPSIAPTIVLMLILAISGLFSSNFDQIFVLRNAVNASASNVIGIYVYQQSFMYNRFDYATAVGLFQSLVAAILLISANATSGWLTGNSIF